MWIYSYPFSPRFFPTSNETIIPEEANAIRLYARILVLSPVFGSVFFPLSVLVVAVVDVVFHVPVVAVPVVSVPDTFTSIAGSSESSDTFSSEA